MSETDADKLKKLVKALDDLVEFGESVLADGKVDLSDAAKLPALVPVVQALVDTWGAREELVAELKDLDYKEVIELIEAAQG